MHTARTRWTNTLLGLRGFRLAWQAYRGRPLLCSACIVAVFSMTRHTVSVCIILDFHRSAGH